MKKIFQTEDRDCLRAVVATLTGETKVPDFSSNTLNWMRNLRRWLGRRGFATKVVRNCGKNTGYTIAAVDPVPVVQIGFFAHSVLMKGNKVVHDPGRRRIKKNYEFCYGIEVRKA